MDKITIRKIGPIDDVSFILNKMNVFIGPQSSGKSTIAKIISYCKWVEKRFILDGEYNDDFAEKFMEFHRVSDSYFYNNSYIKYESDSVIIEYKGYSHEQNISKVNDGLNYTNSKNIYIPAERNFVSAIENLRKYKRTNDNIMNFVYDWAEIRDNYPLDKKYSILNLDVSYYYVSESDADMLSLDKEGKNLKLNNASSGLQSLVPLLLPLEYMTGDLFDIKNMESVDEKLEMANLFFTYFNQLIDDKTRKEELLSELKEKKGTINLTDEEYKKLFAILSSRREYHHSQFIFEEPEQNLFPETQRELVYYMVEKLMSNNREHRLLLTTHSPYILYALNNCMLAGLVYNKMREQDKQRVKCSSALITPNKVSIYQIDNGKVEGIQQPDGLIGNNYFDNKMKDLMDDFYVMLNYYGK
ncbi:MAG: ATP-binding protein [Tannerella sp.]|jgi:predicted ATPase|nr:ATP-binding protein [Tannerella sp.]